MRLGQLNFASLVVHSLVARRATDRSIALRSMKKQHMELYPASVMNVPGIFLAYGIVMAGCMHSAQTNSFFLTVKMFTK